MVTLQSSPRCGRRAKGATLTTNASTSHGELSDRIELGIHPRDGGSRFFTLSFTPEDARAFARFIMKSRHGAGVLS